MRHSFLDSAVRGGAAGPVTRVLYTALVACVSAYAQTYRLEGQIQPREEASVTLHGATMPFNSSTLASSAGRFTFKNLRPGAYTISVFMPGSGEARQTVEVGAGTADRRGCVRITLQLKDSDFQREPLHRRHAVTAKELAIPDSALREYDAARKDLSKPDIPAAVRHLERAVEIAPAFSAAWNNLGTIAYQTRNFLRAEECFRQALRHDPSLYEALVNLGGVLINLRELDEALELNVHAVLVRPQDALANAQLGMTYFELHNPDSALKYLERARKLDPAHFSHPQIYLAVIHISRNEKSEAADVLEEFITQHPDHPAAAEMRGKIAEWRK